MFRVIRNKVMNSDGVACEELSGTVDVSFSLKIHMKLKFHTKL